MEDPFEKLAPPRGGLEGLREKLEARERHFSAGFRLPRLAAGLAVVLAMLAIGYRYMPPAAPDYGIFQPYMEPAQDREAVRLLETDGSRLRLVQQPTDNPAVRLYWVEEAEDG